MGNYKYIKYAKQIKSLWLVKACILYVPRHTENATSNERRQASLLLSL